MADEDEEKLISMVKMTGQRNYKLNEKQRDHLRNLSNEKKMNDSRTSIKSRTQRSTATVKKGRETILSRKAQSSNGGASRQSIGGTISGPQTIVNKGAKSDSRQMSSNVHDIVSHINFTEEANTT